MLNKIKASCIHKNRDTFFSILEKKVSYEGITDKNIRFIENFQLLDRKLWNRFVQQFREQSDSVGHGWKGEYWGKMMRGACLVYSYTKNSQLYDVLTETVKDIMDTADKEGRISSYDRKNEFSGWDIWSRKYVMLGMEYYLGICENNDFSQQIIGCICKEADCILKHIGKKEEGKKSITSASDNWRGLNSSSVLEPFVYLYEITGQKQYLDFCLYIVKSGGTDVENIFKLAYENNFKPYQYPVTKAYEMVSCFEGLAELYRVTGNEKYRIAVINFADSLLISDFTVIGSCGCTHELFDHSSVRQANTENGELAQETCVTVTLMKFFCNLMLLTGDSRYADAFEISMYNAYFGAVNNERSICTKHTDCISEPLPFDSYSPLVSGMRGRETGGFQIMSDGHCYGCCACIGSAGAGLIPEMHILKTKNGFAINLFIEGEVSCKTCDGKEIVFKTETLYPAKGLIKIKIITEQPVQFTLLIRNPLWNKNAVLTVGDSKYYSSNGYFSADREWKNEDEIVLEPDMKVRAVKPTSYGTDILMTKVNREQDYIVPVFDREDPLASHHIALLSGPLVLAQDSRFGYDVDVPWDIIIEKDGSVNAAVPDKKLASFEDMAEFLIPVRNGTPVTVCDYGSAGKLWNEKSRIAAWIRTP